MKNGSMILKRFAAMALAGCIALFVSASCGTKSYTIDGTVEDPSLEGAVVHKTASYSVSEQFSGIKDDTFNPEVDSTVVKDGKFSFSGKTDAPDYCTISVGKDERGFALSYATVVVEPGARLTVTIGADHKARVAGSSSNALLQKHEAENEAFSARIKEIRDKLTSGNASAEETEALQAKWEEVLEEMYAADYQFVKNNINNPAAWASLYNAGVTTVNGDNAVERLKELVAGADERTQQLGDYKDILRKIETLERTAVGQPFIDLEMDDPEGNKMKLSDYAGKGNYLLVDFWASWCGPCKAEMPNVVKCYHKYKDRGLDIVSISLDSKKENWVKAIDEWGMPWHHMSDIAGWDCEGAKVYAVNGIPHMMLLGPDGTILARNLYGESLYAKLAEIFPE